MVQNLSSLLLASRLLAASLEEVLPGVRFLLIHEAFGGFVCEFSYQERFSSEILTLLEERIRKMVRENLEVRVMEMVPFSAAEWLKKRGQPERARQVLASDSGYVHLLQMNHFVDWCEGVVGGTSTDAGMVRLVDISETGTHRYRILGFAGQSKNELQNHIKAWKEFPSFNHESKGIQFKLWNYLDHERIWLSNGLDLRRKICHFWKKSFSPISLETMGSMGREKEVAKKLQVFSIQEFIFVEGESFNLRGLLDQPVELTLKVSIIEMKKKNCISLLQTVNHSLKMLGFNVQLKRKGKRDLQLDRWLEDEGLSVSEYGVSGDGESGIVWMVQDRLAQDWELATLSLQAQWDLVELTVWIERNLALLLEMSDEMFSLDKIERDFKSGDD